MTKMTDVLYALKDQDRYLYHYTNALSLVGDGKILSGDRLRFSTFDRLNDPRESKEWSFGLAARRSIDLPDGAMEQIKAELNRLVKYSLKIACFVTDPYEALVTRAREDKGEDIIGAIYERGHSRPRMWDHYADRYSGVDFHGILTRHFHRILTHPLCEPGGSRCG